MSELELSMVLKADGSGLVGTVRTSREEIEKLTKGSDKAGKGMGRFSSRTDQAAKTARQLNMESKNLFRSLFSLRSLMAGLGVGLVSKSFVEAASTSEQYRVRLKVLLGSVEEGNRLFREMADYASRVPFEYEQIMSSATQLAGVMRGGVDEIKQWMPLIGDLAAASGLSIEQTTEQVIRMYSAGAGAADLFRERGILAMLGFQAGATYSAQETRKKLMDEWRKTNSQFRGATEELAKTWSGGISMLSDKWFSFRNQVMDAGLFDWMKSLIGVIDDDLGSALDNTGSKAKTWSDSTINAVEAIAIGAAGVSDQLAAPMRMIKDLASDMWDGFKRLPSWAKEVGILGALLGGTKGKVLLLGMAKFMSDTKVTADWWAAYSGGHVGFMEWFTSGNDKAKQRLAELRAAGVVVVDDMPNVPDALFGDGGDGNTRSAEEQARAFFTRVRNGMQKVGNDTKALGGEVRNTGKQISELTGEQRNFLDSLKEEARLLKYTGRELEVQTALSRAHRLGIKDQDAAIRELVEGMYELRKAQDDTKASAEPMAQIYEDTATSIRQSFRDTFRDVFDNGLDGFKGFTERMKNVFKDMLADMATLAIARPIIIQMTGAIGSMMGISPMAQANVMQQLGANAVGSAAGNAGWLGLGNFGSQGISGSWYGSYVPYAAAGIGGAMFGNAYSRGDTRATIAGGLGAAIGFGLGGPLGAIVGGALGGSAFGSKTRTDRRGVDLDVTGTSVSGRQWEDKSRRRSFFRGTARWREYSDLSGEIRGQIETTFATIRESVYEFGTALDRDLVSRLNGFRTSYSGELKNLSDWISDVTEDMLRTALPGLEQFRRAGEETQAVVQRLSQTLGMMESLTTSIGAQLQLLRGESSPLDESARTIRSLWEKLGNTSDIQQRISLENDLYQQIMQRYQSEMSMIASVTDALGTTLTNIEFGNQTPNQQLAALQSSFESLLQQSQNLAGTELASVAQQLNQLASPLLNTARQLYASGAGYQSVYDLITGGLGDVRQRLVASGETKREQTISNLEQISRLVNAERDKLTENSAGNVNISLRVVTPDGRELKQETLDDILRRSRAGEIIIDARGVAS